jgi:hyperosmotically inducible periplasmic protein
MNGRRAQMVLVGVLVAVFGLTHPAPAADIDQKIEAAAQNSYIFKTYLKGDDIRVVSKGGVVILSGTVPEERHKTLARETVESLPGVKRVDDQLQVGGKKPDEGSDAWVSVKVKAALVFHRNVSAVRTKVHVKDGMVTLTGVAISQAEKDLAGEYAKDVEGVKEVKNQMTVGKVPASERTWEDKIDDASVTAQVKAVLFAHRSTSAIKTGVRTQDGVVTLTGTAKNAAEKDLITKLTSDINGVVKVVNDMTIAP